MSSTFRKVEEQLRKVLAPHSRALPITLETELYRDLGIYGDVLAFDVVLWATREFDIAGTFHLAHYAPGEQPFFGLLRWLGKKVGKKERHYRSLTVRDIVTAVETRRWPDS